jgi:hypothetical protein
MRESASADRLEIPPQRRQPARWDKRNRAADDRGQKVVLFREDQDALVQALGDRILVDTIQEKGLGPVEERSMQQ